MHPGRPGFTVYRHGHESGYCADNLNVVRIDGNRFGLSFICSGTQTTVPVDEVKSVQFHHYGSSHCYHCDAPLSLNHLRMAEFEAVLEAEIAAWGQAEKKAYTSDQAAHAKRMRERLTENLERYKKGAPWLTDGSAQNVA